MKRVRDFEAFLQYAGAVIAAIAVLYLAGVVPV
jgi:hypothetical protein